MSNELYYSCGWTKEIEAVPELLEKILQEVKYNLADEAVKAGWTHYEIIRVLENVLTPIREARFICIELRQDKGDK